jgi:hypothetical protein
MGGRFMDYRRFTGYISDASLIILLLYAIIHLVIGLKAIIKNKPSIVKSKWSNVVLFSLGMQYIIDNMIDLFRFGFRGSSPINLIFLMLSILFIISLIFALFIEQGYCAYCVNNIDFRNAVIFSLNNISIKFEEKTNEFERKIEKIELIELDNELNMYFAVAFGASTLKLRNKKDKIIFKKIIGGIRQYFKENNIKSKKMVAIFYLIFGILFIVFGVGFAKFIIR